MERIDFAELKTRVPLASVLARYNVELRGNGDQKRGNCPLHPEKSKGSFSVNGEKWNCFYGACEGKGGGDILKLVSLVEGCKIREAAEKLAKECGCEGKRENLNNAPSDVKATALEAKPTADSATANQREEPGPVANKPLGWEFKRDNLQFGHPYVLNRISIKTAEFFGVGAYSGPGKTMKDRVVIPIHDEHGALLGYAGRALNGQEPRYLLPAGLHKSLVLFNLHRVDDAATELLVVEGFWSVFHLWECGFPNVVALMGSTASERQLELLSQFDRVTLMLDGDDAGRTGSAEAAARLSLHTFVRQVRINGQPDSLTEEELKKALA